MRNPAIWLGAGLLKKMRLEKRLRITGRSASVWRWRADLVWQGVNCGMGQITSKLQKVVVHVIAMPALVLNLSKILCTFMKLLTCLLIIFMPSKNVRLCSRY